MYYSNNFLIKLGDFGISKTLENTCDFAKSFLGTPYFLSPEMCKGSMYNYKSDIWMVGCVIYEACTLNKPFSGQTFHVSFIFIKALMQSIISGVHSPIPDIYSNELKQLIDILLTKSPDDRPMIQDLLNQHVFIKEKYENFLESKKKIDQNMIKISSKKLIIMNYQTLSRNKEEMMKPNNSSYYYENNPYDVNDLKVMSNKGYESTPLKKIKDTISGTAHSTNDSYTKLSKFYMSNSEVLDTSMGII
jgi:serine/threonine protein kinase